MISAITHHYFALSRLISALETRSIIEEVQPAQLDLETEFAKALVDPLIAFYKAPFKNGFGSVPTKSKDAIRLWLQKQYEAHPEWTDTLKSAITDYAIQSTELGITQGISILDGKGTVKLEDEGVLASIEQRATELVSTGTDQSLVDTTADDLAANIFKNIVADVAISAALVVLVTNAPARSVLIADSETNRFVNVGLIETYKRNGVAQMQYIAREDEKTCKICGRDHEKKFLIPPSILLPRHPHCRCFYFAVLDDWNPPIEWWHGGN